MSGQWPPEWEDSDTGLPDEWTVDDAGLDPEAAEVTLFLASVPSPVLPASFEARISAAIAAEATARANGTAADGIESASTELTGTGPTRMPSAATGSLRTESAGTGPMVTEPAGTWSAHAEPVNAGIAAAETDDAETTGRSSPPEFSPAGTESGSPTAAKHRRRRTSAASRGAAARSRPAGSRPDGRRRRFRLPSPALTGPLLVILVIAGFAVGFAQLSGGSSSSSSSGLASGGTSAESSAASASGHSSPQSGRNAAAAPAGSQFESNQSGLDGRFAVTESGTQYQGSTLASQVRTQLVAVTPSAVTPAASAPSSAFATPAASSTASIAASASSTAAPSTAPSAKLAGCVSRVTGGVTPRLVDQASYDGIPAYIIAVPSHVWVVKLGCTAADPQEITSVSLTGLFRESQRPRIG
jgi:hypothetical protein